MVSLGRQSCALCQCDQKLVYPIRMCIDVMKVERCALARSALLSLRQDV